METRPREATTVGADVTEKETFGVLAWVSGTNLFVGEPKRWFGIFVLALEDRLCWKRTGEGKGGRRGNRAARLDSFLCTLGRTLMHGGARGGGRGEQWGFTNRPVLGGCATRE